MTLLDYYVTAFAFLALFAIGFALPHFASKTDYSKKQKSKKEDI